MATHKTITPKDYEDQFSTLHSINTRDVVDHVGNLLREIAAKNLSNADYIKFTAAMRRHRLTNKVISEADLFNVELDKKQAEQSAVRQIESERLQAEANRPINRFIRAVKNNDLEALNEWSESTSIEEKRAAKAEFENLIKKRGLPLTVEEQRFGLSFLYSTKTER